MDYEFGDITAHALLWELRVPLLQWQIRLIHKLHSCTQKLSYGGRGVKILLRHLWPCCPRRTMGILIDFQTTREGRTNLKHYHNKFYCWVNSTVVIFRNAWHMYSYLRQNWTDCLQVCCSPPKVWDDLVASVMSDAFQGLTFFRAKTINYFSIHCFGSENNCWFYSLIKCIVVMH